MRVIACLASKGGVGRTVVVMALAAAFAARGLRVGVIDASDGARGLPLDAAGPLEGWRERVARGTPLEALLWADTARDASGLLAALDFAAGAPEDGGRDVVLVDTAGRTDDRARLALRAADLVVAPFRSAADEAWVVEGLGRDLARTGLPVLGLPCGVMGRPEAASLRFGRIVEAQGPGGQGRGGRWRLARVPLPGSLPLVHQLWHGPLPSLDPATVAPEGARPPALAQARAAWAAALSLAEEAWDLATGPDPAAADARPPVLRLARMRRTGVEGESGAGAESKSGDGPGDGGAGGPAIASVP